MKLETIATKFQEMAAKVGQALGPSRDALAGELTALQASPPAFVDVHAPAPAVEHAACDGCRRAGHAHVEQRARYLAYGARVDALRAQLFRKSYGAPDELDEAGRALTEVRREIRAAIDLNDTRAQKWGDLIEEADGSATHVSAAVIGTVAKDLVKLYRVVENVLTYEARAEVEAGIRRARAELASIMARPVRVPVPADVEREAIPRHDPFAETQGLIPSPSDPSILAGTVRFTKRG